MNPRQFLYAVGVILIGLGIFGFFDPNPVADRQALQFDVWENWAHTLVGIFAIAMAYLLPRAYRWWLTAFFGASVLTLAILGYEAAENSFPNIGGANLENPENIFHLVIFAWTMVVAIVSFNKTFAESPAEAKRFHKPMEPPIGRPA